MITRTLFHSQWVAPRAPRLALNGVSRSWFRVWPTDLDVLQHMNNGKYLSILDVARYALVKRTGIDSVFRREGWYPVVVGQTISYRKSLNPWMRFAIESRILGFDDQAVCIEQRFVRPDPLNQPEIYAQAIVRCRILRRSGGVVPVSEVILRTGADQYDFDVPDDVRAWGSHTRLPSTKAPAPSIWDSEPQ